MELAILLGMAIHGITDGAVLLRLHCVDVRHKA